MRQTLSRKKIILYLCLTIGLIAGSVIYFRYNPEGSMLFPKCPFLLLTGLKCPGCGSQRAIHALLHLDIGAAFCYNAFLVISIPYVILLLAGKAVQFFTSNSDFAFQIQRPAIIWSYFAFTMLFWISRNVFGF
ncbi:MAG: DUF2752 domain-containing protein [Tannerella sp.]|jgi:hypothetical protein|nr:DUF2752 domain-containing protein [Tannerella sp.]